MEEFSFLRIEQLLRAERQRLRRLPSMTESEVVQAGEFIAKLVGIRTNGKEHDDGR
jgi:hypothetical protein